MIQQSQHIVQPCPDSTINHDRFSLLLPSSRSSDPANICQPSRREILTDCARISVRLGDGKETRRPQINARPPEDTVWLRNRVVMRHARECVHISARFFVVDRVNACETTQHCVIGEWRSVDQLFASLLANVSICRVTLFFGKEEIFCLRIIKFLWFTFVL